MFLTLVGTRIMDEGLKLLVERKRMHDAADDARWMSKLYLGGPGVTDASIPALASLEGLSEIVLQDTDVTEAGVNQLQTARPTLPIHYLENDRPRL